MKRNLLKLALCAMALLPLGAWADEANLTPTADTYFSWADGETTTSYGNESSLKCGIWQNYWHNQSSTGLRPVTPRIAVFKFDVSLYKGKITAATFKVTGTNSNNKARSLYLGYFDLTSWSESSTAENSEMVTRNNTGLNIHPFVDEATDGGSGGLSQSIAKGETTEVSFTHTNLLSYLNNDEDGIVSLIIYGLGEECTVNSKEAANGKPTLVLTYTNETLYTATFTEEKSLSPTVTIYSDSERTSEVLNGSLTNGTTYYYTATLAGYYDYKGSFTVSGVNPTVNFTMSAKTVLTSLTVNYKDGEDIVFGDSRSVTGLYVGDSYTVPYRMYVSKAGKLYQANKQGSTPYYGVPTALTAETVIDISVTEVDLNGGTLALLADLDDTAQDNSGNNASYGLAYGNKAYTSDVTLEPGVYTFIVKAMNRGRGSAINVGETIVCEIDDVNSTSNIWTDKTFENVEIPAAGAVTLVAGDKTIDYYDIIIAIRTGDYKISSAISSAGWATLYSPYALDFSETGVTVYTATDNGETVRLNEIASGEVPANTPVVLYKEGADGSAIDVPVIAEADPVGSNDLSVVGAGGLTGEDGVYVLANKANGVGFYLWDKTVTLNEGKVCLRTGGSGAREFLGFDEGETTSLREMKNEELGMKNAEYFNLNGQRVAQPTKGLYIVNGRKVVIK